MPTYLPRTSPTCASIPPIAYTPLASCNVYLLLMHLSSSGSTVAVPGDMQREFELGLNCRNPGYKSVACNVWLLLLFFCCTIKTKE